jgi:hypothetical protein
VIGSKEVVRVRLEVDFEILIGELDDLERDSKRVSLSRFVDIWEPEMREAKIMLRLMEVLNESGSKGKVD